MSRWLLVPLTLFALVGFNVATASETSSQAERIGFQSGVAASANAWCAVDPAHCAAYRKLERSLRILVADHDAAIPVVTPPPPPPPPPSPPPAPRLAPMTHYKAGGADARYCVINQPGVTRRADGSYIDEGGYTYSDNGLSISGGRSGQFVPELKGADSMDGREPCDGYTKDGRTFPPWPAKSYER